MAIVARHERCAGKSYEETPNAQRPTLNVERSTSNAERLCSELNIQCSALGVRCFFTLSESSARTEGTLND
jgi:hypothetical protein